MFLFQNYASLMLVYILIIGSYKRFVYSDIKLQEQSGFKITVPTEAHKATVNLPAH